MLQTFPATFEPTGSRRRLYGQIGKAVPPMLAEAVVRPLVDGTGFVWVNDLHRRPADETRTAATRSAEVVACALPSRCLLGVCEGAGLGQAGPASVDAVRKAVVGAAGATLGADHSPARG